MNEKQLAYLRNLPYNYAEDNLTDKDIEEIQEAFYDWGYAPQEIMREYELPLWKVWKILKNNLYYEPEDFIPLDDYDFNGYEDDGYDIEEDDDYE